MDSPMLKLYRKSLEEPLSSVDLLSVEEARKKNPWFPLPWYLLAKSRLHSPVKGDLVQAASALSSNRPLLRTYLTGEDEFPPFFENLELLETPVQSNPFSELNVPPITEALKKEEITVSVPSVPPVSIPEISQAQLPEKPRIEPKIAIENIPMPVLDEKKIPKEKIAEPAKIQSKTGDIGINFGLETRVGIRSAQFLKLVPKIAAELAFFKTQTSDEIPIIVKAEVKIESKPVAPIIESKVIEKISEPIPEVVEEIKVAVPEVIIPIEEKPFFVSQTNITEIPELKSDEKQVLKPKGKPKKEINKPNEKSGEKTLPVINKGKPEVEVPSVFESEYKIGAFSGFSFLSNTETKSEKEKPDPPAEIEETRKKGKEIILSNKGEERVVEIQVSEEQLKKYFKGKQPAQKKEEIDLPSEEKKEKKKKKKGDSEKKTPEVKDLRIKAGSNETTLDRRKYVNELIERFIDNEPGLATSKNLPVNQENLAKTSLEDDDSIVTETLAKIHEKQGNIAKAIKIYQKLSLQFPEKKAYFVTLISKLKK